MHPYVNYTLLGLVLLLTAFWHRGLFMLPVKYKEKTTLVAAHNAFKEDEYKLPKGLAPYRHKTNLRRLLSLYDVELHRDAPQKFSELRRIWDVDEEDYVRECLGRWESFGTAGLSGSMFFHSSNKQYMLKSLGRAFETRFLHEHFLPRYFEFVKSHPDSLIHKIYDVLYTMDRRLGECLRLSPNHYIIIENIAYGKQDDWETFDLKPTNYLEPVRDLLPNGMHISGATDVLPPDKVILASAEERASLLARARADVAFLASIKAIDYSVLLVRAPDGTARWGIIDTFWSLKTPRAKATKKASDTAGLPQQTVTADADGYAREVLKLLEKCVKVREVVKEQAEVKQDVTLVDL
ncbi:uncharacterized protein C8Q71DRAFT_747116 [Rhodofomes roseus]|uniref:PIPK domain-containing protein n=1 Tax=Rhodofomes roseus TaxID=34475 RepID=A0ABQ8KL16_9APHY|nr:uncharacterized protein C8Q71DRAFT_747116 [Rhodofomes roseus]KAH9839007.1 hypothetical protein C8Q71DRAFT_747116 [Rhodofomes roseus]